MSRKTIKITTGIVIAAGALGAVAAVAQEGGLQFTGRLAQTFDVSDNPDFVSDPTGTTLRSRTDLSFGLSSVTAVQSLDLDLGLGLRYALRTSSETPVREGVTDPFLRFAYERSSATALFTATAAYSKSDVGDLRLVTDPDEGDLIVDDGEVERTSYSLGLDTGIGAPFGLSLDARYSRRVYTETTDPDLTDDETFDFSAIARFAVTPTTDVNAIARYSRDQEFEGSVFDRKTTRLGFGVDHELSQASRVSFDLTNDVIDTFDTGGEEREEGYSVSLGYNQDVPNGAFGVSVASELESIGNRNTLNFSRDFDLPDGDVRLELGLTNNDTSDLSPIFRVNYTRDLATGQISARVAQIINQDRTSDDEFRDRILALDYSQTINSVSSWSTTFGYADSENLTDDTRVRRTDFSVSYRHDLTRDWDVVSGYRYRQSRSSTEDDRTSNTLFVTFEREFAARP